MAQAAQQRFEADKNLASLGFCNLDLIRWTDARIGAVGVRLAKHKRSELCLSAITVAELRFWADERRSRKIHQAIDAFLSGVGVLAFDNSAAEKFGAIAAALATAGEPIGQLNTLIAGHALPKPSWKPEAWLELRCEITTSPQQPPTPIPRNPSL